ncbi:unnamed protein product, partial [Porites evermanni]
MPLDHACITDQEFSCGFKSHAIGEYAIGLSKSNQSLHGKYLVTLRDQSLFPRPADIKSTRVRGELIIVRTAKELPSRRNVAKYEIEHSAWIGS